MTTYVAPVRDMLFAMKELAGLDEIAALPGNEEASADLVEAILDEAGKFASEVLAPINAQGDRQGCKCADGVVTTADGFREAYEAFCANGWNAMPASPEFGGQGLPTLVSTPVLEMWKSSNMAFSLCQMLTLGAVEAIAHHASDELKQRFLPPMVEGRWTGTMNLTEPQAGSDLSAVRSKAVPEGEHYRISGTKIFITWGEHDMAENIVHLVLARLPDAPEGVKGISLFVVPKFLVNADGSLGELVADEHADNPSDTFEQNSDRELMMRLLPRLPEREEMILRLRFGLDDGQEKTLEELGDQFGLTRERIRQLQNDAFRKLRELMESSESELEPA